MAERMVELAKEQDGFLGVESASRTSEGFGITVSYWRDLESIKKWKAQSEHAAAQRMGRRDAFYRNYRPPDSGSSASTASNGTNKHTFNTMFPPS